MNTATQTVKLNPSLHIVCSRKRFYICAGKSRLSEGFRSQAQAETELTKGANLWNYYAGSAGVSLENTPARVIVAG